MYICFFLVLENYNGLIIDVSSNDYARENVMYKKRAVYGIVTKVVDILWSLRFDFAQWKVHCLP